MSRAVVSIAFVGALAGLAGCGGGTAAPPAEKASAKAEEKVAPDFALPDLDGKIVHLSDSAGKIRLVNFWATWCAPCREEIPTFKELHETYGPRGLTVIAISTEEAGVVAPFVKENAIPYTNLIGGEEIGEKFGGLYGFPTTFLLDGTGKILQTYVGMVPRKQLEESVTKALGAAS
jgi:thiol-disulfide isomerase/thioredoxin